VILDSRRVGWSKPDPAIFRHAIRELGCDAGNVLMVGDSFQRDIRPAKSIGMKTAWLENTSQHERPDLSLVDFRLQQLADLPCALSTATATA